MKKALKIVFLGSFLAISAPLTSTTNIGHTDNRSETEEAILAFDWNPVIDAIIQVESGGDTTAVSGTACGAMQITPVLVKECNLILESRNSDKRFTLSDRYSLEKSKEMFLLVQSEFNPSNSIEKAIRRWNGGPSYGKKSTQRYYNKVMAQLK